MTVIDVCNCIAWTNKWSSVYLKSKMLISKKISFKIPFCVIVQSYCSISNIGYVWKKPPLSFLFFTFQICKMKTFARHSFIRSHYPSRNYYFILFVLHREHDSTVLDTWYLSTSFGYKSKRMINIATLWLMFVQRVSNKIIINTRNWTWQGENKNNPFHEPWLFPPRQTKASMKYDFDLASFAFHVLQIIFKFIYYIWMPTGN